MQSTDYMSDQKKAVICEELESGSAMIQIGRAINPPATVFSYLRYHGDIQPHQRTRRLSTLSLEEREEISRGLAANCSIRSIAGLLERHPSTISRENNRNGVFTNIGPQKLIQPSGSTPNDQNSVFWRRMRSSNPLLHVNSWKIGRRSRFLAG